MSQPKAISASKGPRGGTRAGAGRPRVDAPVRVTLYLTEAQAATAKALGGGNATAGVRALLDQAATAGVQPAPTGT